MEGTKKRSSFSGKLGFVLAAAGSAVGLGNIWRFPYLVAQYGGGIFLLIYIILAVTFGFGLMTAEVALGRKTGLSAIGAFKKLNKKWSFVGWIASIVPMIILPYYSVIGGWVIKYMTTFLSPSGARAAAGDGFFTGFVSQTFPPIFWFCLFIGLTALVVLFGVKKGVERVSKVLMPVLVVLSVVIAIFCVTRPGALEGVKYYLLPDFSKFSIKTVLAALGQLFYSMSLAMGIMITYGSYMKKDVDLESSVRQIEIFDTGIAFLAGLMIVPAVFVFMGPEQLKTGPSLMFVVLPKVFSSMPFGTVVGFLFFLLVFFAALTSAISLFETVVSIVNDKFKISRKLCCLIVLIGSLALGLFSTLGFGPLSFVQIIRNMSILDFFDFISNSVIMPIVALLTSIFVGYVVKTKTITEEVRLSSKFRGEKLFHVVVRYIAPIGIVAILISSVLNSLGVITL